MEKKTRKQLAEELHMNVKTMRESRRYVENLEIIAGNLGKMRKNLKKFWIN